MKLITTLIGCALIMSATFVYGAGEKGGTTDINIGVGELQESTGETRIITGQEPGTSPGAIRGNPGRTEKTDESAKPERRRKGNVEMEFKVEEGE